MCSRVYAKNIYVYKICSFWYCSLPTKSLKNASKYESKEKGSREEKSVHGGEEGSSPP